MKPFNLEKSKAGAPVITRDGHEVRIICFDRKSQTNHQIVALLKYGSFEILMNYKVQGTLYDLLENHTPHKHDLMMKD